MIRTIIIDDEQNSRELLTNMLKMYESDVEVLGDARDVSSGIQLIQAVNPDLVFLDIEMPGGDGFELLNAFETINFKVVIVTGYNQYAIKAIKYAALDYLLKPIDLEELEIAIRKAKSTTSQNETTNVQFLQSNYTKKEKPFKQIILPGHKKHIVIELDEIIHLEAKGNYVVFHLQEKENRVVTYPLNYYEELLPNNTFFRVHKSHIVNCNKVESYEPGRAGKAFLSDGTAIDIAARRKTAFKKAIKAIKS